MKQAWVVVLGGLVLFSLLAVTSFVAAAPPSDPPAVSAQVATATPLSEDAEGLILAAGVAPAALTPGAPGKMTSKIIVFNTDLSGAAAVGIEVFDQSGNSIWKTTLPATIPPNGAKVVALPTTIASPFSGSAVVSSDKNVQAFVTDSNATGTARDTYDGTGVMTNILTLPLVRHLAPNTRHSIISVQNTTGTAGGVTLHLYDESGTEVVFNPPLTATIQPSASAYFDTNTLFPSTTFTGTAQLVASGGMNIAAAEQTSYYLDTASFRAQNVADQGTALYVPLVERLQNTAGAILNWSEIFVRNNSGGPVDVTAEFYTAAGVRIGGATTTRNVPANGVAEFLTNKPEFKPLLNATTSFRGWAKISTPTQSTPPALSLYSLEAQNSGRRLFGIAGIPDQGLGTKFACGDTFRISAPTQYSNLMILNPNSSVANVTVKLYKPKTGALAGTKTKSLIANKMWQLSLSDIAFAAAGTAFEGLAVVSSDGPQIAVTVSTQYGLAGVTSANCSRLSP